MAAVYHRRPRLFTGGVALALFLAVIAATVAPESRARPLWVGFNDISIAYHLASPEQDAAVSARAGAEVSRITIDWRAIEPAHGRFDWAPYDALISALRRRGIRPLLVLLFAPNWTWQHGISCDQARQDCKYPPGPAHDADWEAFVAATVRRYPDAVAIEVWNEPNLAGFWSPRPEPRRYAQLLREAASVVRGVAPKIPVLVGGLAPVAPNSGAGLTAGAFLSAVYGAGGRGTFDGIGVHLYPCSSSPRELAAGLQQVRGPRDAADDSSPLWVTEVGVTTTGSTPCAGRSEQQQAEMLARTFAYLSGNPDVRAVIIHTLIDRSGAADDRERGFGVVRTDLSPKPSFCTLGALTSCVGG